MLASMYSSCCNYLALSSGRRGLVVLLIALSGLTAAFTPWISYWGYSSEYYKLQCDRLFFANSFDYTSIDDSGYYSLPRAIRNYWGSESLWPSDIRPVSIVRAVSINAKYRRDEQTAINLTDEDWARLMMQDHERAILGKELKSDLDWLRDSATQVINERYSYIASKIVVYTISLLVFAFLLNGCIRFVRKDDTTIQPRVRIRMMASLRAILATLILCFGLSLTVSVFAHIKGDIAMITLVATLMLTSVVIALLPLIKFERVGKKLANDPEIRAKFVLQSAKRHVLDLDVLIPLLVSHEEDLKSKIETYRDTKKDFETEDQIDQDDGSLDTATHNLTSFEKDMAIHKIRSGDFQLQSSKAIGLQKEIQQMREDYRILRDNKASTGVIQKCVKSIEMKRNELASLANSVTDTLEPLRDLKSRYISMYQKTFQQAYYHGLAVRRLRKIAS